MIYAYARIENDQIVEYPIYQGDLKYLVGFDENSGEEFETPDGYIVVKDTPPPEVELNYNQKIIDDLPKLEDGEWKRVWTVQSLTPEELEFKTQRFSSYIREERNKILATTDWTQLPDSPVDGSIWVSYRQDLRNIPSQPGFPWEVEWPNLPT